MMRKYVYFLSVLLSLFSFTRPAAAQAPTCNAFFIQVPGNNADSIHFFYVGFPKKTYTWTFGDGGTATTTFPWHYYTTPGTYQVCLTVTDSTAGGTCTDTQCQTITISGTGVNCSPRYLNFAGGNNPLTVNFFYIGSAATSFSWNFGDGDTSSTRNQNHTYAAAGTYYACVTITDSTAAGTCTGTYCDSITVTNPVPTCNPRYFQVPSNTNPLSIRFFYFGTQATSYSWDFGDGNTSTQQSPTHVYATPGTYISCVTITDSTSGGTCTGTFCDTVTISIPPPVCTPHFVRNIVPQTDSIRFNYNGGNAQTYAWDFGDGTTSTLQSPTHLYNATGNYVACVTITNTNAGGTCTETFCDTFHVTIHPPFCNARFVRNTVGLDSIQFTYTGNPAGSYLWDFGDGTTSSAISPLHVYHQGGTYHVCVTVSTTNGSGTCSDTYCRNVNIPITPPTCHAQFAHFATSNLDSIAFAYTGTTGLTYTWNFGDGGSSSAQNPSHVYAAPGTYYACVTVHDSTNGGTCNDTWCDSVTVLAAPPVCDAHFQQVTTGNIDSVLFYPLSTTALTYSWDFGDGATDNSTSPSHVYASGGMYYACLTITDSTAGGTCSNTWCDSVNIPYPAPICDAQFAYAVTSRPDSVWFTSTGTAAQSYSWDFGDGSSDTTANAGHTYSASGNYIVCLTVTNTTLGGTCTNTWCDTLDLVIPPPVCDASFGSFAQFNNPDSVYVFANVTTAKTYSWDFGDGTIVTGITDGWHQYVTPGDYTICLTVTDSSSGGKCSTTVCDTVNVPYPAPVCAAAFTSFNTNNADSIQFVYGGTPGLTYTWDFGDGNTSTDESPLHVYNNSVPTVYYVCVTVTDSTAGGTCSSTWCDSLAAFVAPPVCDPSFTFTHSSPDSLFFSADNATAQTYGWDFGDGTTGIGISIAHNYTATGTYQVCLTVSNSNGGSSCTDTYCHTVIVSSVTGVEQLNNNAQTVFVYPNPAHDQFTIELGANVENAAITLYDFEGRKLYSRDRLNSGMNSIDTQDVATGIYYYEITNRHQRIANGKLVIVH